MSGTSRRSLGVRIGLPVAVVTLVLATALVGLHVHEEEARAAETLDGYADLLGGIVLNGLRDAMQANDRGRLQQQLAGFAKSQQVQRIDVVDKRGVVVFSSHPDALGEEFSRDDESCVVCHDARKPPPTTGRTVHHRSPRGLVYRFVQPIVAARECLECHDTAEEGQNLGILLIDLDETQLVGRQLQGARSVSFALVAGFVILLGSVGVIVRYVVISRLRNVRRVLELLRSGTLTSAPTRPSVDEIDELERLIRSVGEELEDRQVQDRAIDAAVGVLDRCPEPAVLTDVGGRVLWTSPALRRRMAASALAQGQALGPLVPGWEALAATAREEGWAVGEGEGAPLLAAVDDGAGRAIALLAVWAPEDGELSEEHTPLGLRPRTDPEWLLYAAAVAAGIAPEPRRWKNVAQIDRRIGAGRRLASELAAASAELAADRAEVDLGALGKLVLWDVGRQLPNVTWRALLGQGHLVRGARYQLRALVRRLGEAAAAQAGPGGQAVLFTQGHADSSRIYVGAWARSDADPVPLDADGKLPLCDLLARNHGGGVEVDRTFDLGPLCQSRQVELPVGTRGVLFVAELQIAPPSKKWRPELVR